MMRPRAYLCRGLVAQSAGIDHEDNIESLDDIAKLDMVLLPSTKKPAYRACAPTGRSDQQASSPSARSAWPSLAKVRSY